MHLTTTFFHTPLLLNIKQITWLFLSLLTFCSSCTPNSPTDTQNQVAPAYGQMNFPDILNLEGLPDSASDRSVYIMTDKGAWFGYALPGAEKPELAGSFTGPFIMTQDNGTWLSRSLSQLHLLHATSGKKIPFANNAKIVSKHAYPGKLVQVVETEHPALSIKTELIFISNKSALTKVEIQNLNKNQIVPLILQWTGDPFHEDVNFTKHTTGVRINFSDFEHIGQISVNTPNHYSYITQSNGYSITSGAQQLDQEPFEFSLVHSFCFSEKEWQEEAPFIKKVLQDPQEAFIRNAKEWDEKISAVLSKIKPQYDSLAYHRIAVKCLQTLNTNWRSAAGFLQHDGLFPSYNYKWFNGFWAWDSWKHAVAVAHYDAHLAQDQIRAMYDFQDEWGMIADCVYRDTLIENHNWRNTKPPLSGWAIWKVFEQSQDTAFLAEMLPKLEAYHQWWYQFRDVDQNGLCEYGSTDGTLIAAKWESGMDNAVRFDSAQILNARSGGHSLDQESVDLNAYLCAEKQYLAKISLALNRQTKRKKYENEASALQQKVSQIFYEEEKNWFFDIKINTREPIPVLGPEGWTPLWTQLASPEQARAVRNTMFNADKFATYIPFPTLSASHPKFQPQNGYWRGPIWIDQVYFAIEGLRNYGFEEEADVSTYQLLDRLEGLKNDKGPIRENYHPLSGEGLEAHHFSWSAAHILLLLIE